MINTIIREVPAEAVDTSFYFDDAYINGEYGENYRLYVITREYGRYYGINAERFCRIRETAEAIADGFADVGGKYATYVSYKECMQDYNIEFTTKRCHDLKEWCKRASRFDPEEIAEYLTITTGEKWNVVSVRGYSQGDYAEVLYCEECHPEKCAIAYGEVYLGACKEFCVIDIDENGEETDACYGFIVADCEAWRPEEYKKIVCEWDGRAEETTRLELISGYHHTTTAEYKAF